jgi:hypothetical protein
VGLGYVESISHETVRQVLLTNELKPWIKKHWCIPTQTDAEFVASMEDVLEVYTIDSNKIEGGCPKREKEGQSFQKSIEDPERSSF